MRIDKKGIGIGDLPQLAVTLVLVAAVFVAGFLILAGLGDSTTNTAADNAVKNDGTQSVFAGTI